jgi:hypothetical protein
VARGEEPSCGVGGDLHGPHAIQGASRTISMTALRKRRPARALRGSARAPRATR